MFAHLRFYSAVLIAGLSTSTVFANPISDLLNSKSTSQQAAAAPAPEKTCLSRPGAATTGLRWVYHREGHRKCWFQAAEDVALKRPLRSRAAKSSAGATSENESTQPRRRDVDDARAELLRAPPETPLPMQDTPDIQVVDAAPLLNIQRAESQRSEKLATDRFISTYLKERQPDVGTTPATTLTPRDAGGATSLPKAEPVILSVSETVDDGSGSAATWIAALLIALGLVSILGSSRSIRQIVLLRG